jgi:thiopeptide-type bacteriocin biosynthesis protein
VVLRSPVYSYRYYSSQNLQKALKQQFFQKAIYLSSEVFYTELQKVNFDLDKLDKKAIDTLKKYFNRMCFRPTPFGLCSASGILNWNDGISSIPFSDDNLRTHVLFSYAKSAQYAKQLQSRSMLQFRYKRSPSLYKTGSEYRFLKSNEENSQIEFIIDSIKTDRIFEKLLNYLSEWRTQQQILVFICTQTGCTNDQADSYCSWLIEKQVVVNHFDANITGEDHLKRLLNHEPVDPDATFARIRSLVKQNEQTLSPLQLNNVPGHASPDEDKFNSSDYYVNLEVALPEGKLDQIYQQDILDALHCLDKFSSNTQNPGLSDFIKRFNQKFDGQTIQLLAALDPETGVSYGDLAVEEDNNNIVKDIAGGNVNQNTTLTWSDAHILLLKKLNGLKDNIIRITDADLENIKTENVSFPPGISVMFRVLDGKVLIESAGGSCASSLIGRFTPFNSGFHNLAKDMATREAESNPGIIFAEIAHICHLHTANIDRREHIYAYEIPVLVQSTLPDEQQIQLDDLWVSVIGGEVMLSSKKHGKRVIPRLSSAFNYTRNDLAIFRFLCDLQKAGIKTNFTLNLSNFFPGLDFYPRVEYKNSILQLAYWNIKKELFTTVLNAPFDSKQGLFLELKKQLNFPQLIALSQHDHQLIFDLDKPADVLFFLDTIKAQKQITIKEYLLPEGEKPIVRDKNGQPHVNQFIASLYHTQPVYRPFNMPLVKIQAKNRKVIPGGEWLYLKIHCHPVRSNELLAGFVAGVVKKMKTAKLISEWFFIRYLDTGYHLRLRFKVNPNQHQQVLNTIHNGIKQHVADGIVSNYTIATYERELERYSPDFMPEFEHAFYGSSNLIASFLQQYPDGVTAKDILEFAVVSVNDILISLGLSGKLLIDFLERVFNSFFNEFSAINELKYQLDIEFRKQKATIELVRKNEPAYYRQLKLNKARELFIRSLADLKAAVITKTAWKEKWAGDLIHMHLNRLFVNDSRKQEMAIYYFLLKHERSAQARQSKASPI